MICTECELPARGPVPVEPAVRSGWGAQLVVEVPAHYCRQCGEHCQLGAYLLDQAAAGRQSSSARPVAARPCRPGKSARGEQ